MANIDSYSESNRDGFFSLYNGAKTKVGQAFTGDGNVITSAKFHLAKTGSPTGYLTYTIYKERHATAYGTDSFPLDSVLAVTYPLDVTTLTGSYALVELSFSTALAPISGEKYILLCEYSGSDISNYVMVGTDASSPSHAGNSCHYTTSWVTDSTRDCCFYAITTPVTLPNSTAMYRKQGYQ